MSVGISGFSSYNKRLGPVQTDTFTMYTLLMPITETSLNMFATPINLKSNQAETHNIRRLEQLPLTNSLNPISRGILNDGRIANVTGSIIPIVTAVYGSQIVIDNQYEVSTEENIQSACMTLFADFDARLTETLLFNMLKRVSTNYPFSLGGEESPTVPNIADLLQIKAILQRNRAHRAIEKLEWRATDQIGTNPVGKSFVAHCSVSGRTAFETNITDPNDYVRPAEMPGRSDYLYNEVAYYKRADTSLYSSTEMTDSPENRIIFVHGDQAYALTNKTPFTSKISITPSYLIDFGTHTIMSNRRVLGMAILRDEVIVSGTFTDK